MKKCANSKCFKQTSNKLYCSRSCSHSAAPRRKRKCADGVSVCSMPQCDCQSRKRAVCVVCGKPRSRYARRYCSSMYCKALDENKTNELLAAWLAGDVSADVSVHNPDRRRPTTAGWARAYLLREAGWACTQCDWNTPHPLTGIPPLEIDHVDGDRFNNYRSNLVVLCPNCHALTPTHRGMNKKTMRARAVVQLERAVVQ